MTRKQARAIVGGLSKTSKLPCWSWGINAEHCKMGAWIRANVPESACAICYVHKGLYSLPNVRAAHARSVRCAHYREQGPLDQVAVDHSPKDGQGGMRN